MAVLIPARNEEELLPACLLSVARARAALPVGVTADVVVVADESTDGTLDVARSALSEAGIVLPCDRGCVGAARALAAATALARHGGDVGRCWLANTDADCEVPETWLVDQLRLASKGFAAVAGIVDVRDFREHAAHVEGRFRSSYTLHADWSHPHVHGANLGVRADTYLMAGGWNGLPTAEDHDLWTRLRGVGALQVSDARLCVLTSGRRTGRAPMGFAQALAAHNDVAACSDVEVAA